MNSIFNFIKKVFRFILNKIDISLMGINGNKSVFYSLFDYYYSKNILKLKKNINLSQRQTEYKQKGYYKLPKSFDNFANVISKKINLNNFKKTKLGHCINYNVSDEIIRNVQLFCNNDLSEYLDELAVYYKSNIFLANIRISKIFNFDGEDDDYANFYHRDNVRFTHFKIFIPLENVDEFSGPTHIISIDKTKQFIKKAKYKKRSKINTNLNDIEYKNIADKGQATVCSTGQCFHKAGIPSKDNSRLQMTLSFVAYPKLYEENKHLDYFHNKNLMVSTNYNVINYLAKSKEFIDMFKLFYDYKFFANKNF